MDELPLELRPDLEQRSPRSPSRNAATLDVLCEGQDTVRYLMIALPIAGVMLTGCATSVDVRNFYEADSAALARYVAMGIVVSTDGLTGLGTVTGLYCYKGASTGSTRDVTHPLAEQMAVDQVKLKAAEKGATHISQPHCEARDKGDFVNNCYGTVTCTAEALSSD